MKKLGLVIIIICILFITYGFYNGLEITNYTYGDKELPREFDGFRIAFISDLHCKLLGRKQGKLIHAITSCNPDIVVFTGDMLDGDHKDITPIKDLLVGLKGKYPMYAVSGNHEKDNILNYGTLLKYYEEYGVVDLDDKSLKLSKNGAHIGIYGLSYRDRYYIKKTSHKPDKDKNEFNILLYHDATAFSLTSLYEYNLVLSGHTHGGIIRFPFLGGLINNDLTLLSEFDNGMFHMNGSTLISHRGIGDSYFPRFYNRPEVVCITLRTSYE
jgi:predicted MPP superfamily phosphohydrolase